MSFWARLLKVKPLKIYCQQQRVAIAVVAICAAASTAWADTKSTNEILTNQQVDLTLLAKLGESILDDHGFADSFEAEVWFESMYPRLEKFRISDDEKIQILQWVHKEAHHSGLSPHLVLAVIDVESDFNRYAVSRAGAQGLMQVMSFWKKELGRQDDNLIDTQTNLRYGTTILSYYLERAKGDTTEALARYNGSYPKTWYAERVYQAMEFWQ